jgi:heptosyltransferase-3
VIVLQRLGDVLLTTPLIRSLRRGLPQASIDILVFRGTEEMLEGNPDITSILTLHPRASISESLVLIGQIVRRYDLAISTQTSDKPVFYALMAARRRIGFVDDDVSGMWWKRRVFHRPLPAAKDNHRVIELLRLAQSIGIEECSEIVGPATAITAPRIPGCYAVLHANPKFPFRRWTVEGWRELAQTLAQRGLKIIATGGPDQSERDYLDHIWNLTKISVTRLDGKLSWPELASLLRDAAVYIGPDTSMTHLAASVGAPTIALYGPASPHIMGPWPIGGLDRPWKKADKIQRRRNVWVIQNPLPCLPCERLGCERRLDSYSCCLDELSVRQVLIAVDQALAPAPAH